MITLRFERAALATRRDSYLPADISCLLSFSFI